MIFNAQPSIAVAPPMLHRAAREHRRASAMDRRWITKPSAILPHQICIDDVYKSIADVSLMCRRCVWYIFNLGVHRRMFADCSAIYRRWYLASKHREKISMHALKFFSMSRCLGEAWPIIRRTERIFPHFITIFAMVFYN